MGFRIEGKEKNYTNTNNINKNIYNNTNTNILINNYIINTTKNNYN
jgi:hypothetical protein